MASACTLAKVKITSRITDLGKPISGAGSQQRSKALVLADSPNKLTGAMTQAVVTSAAKPGPRKVCVRVVDVFGFEAEVVTVVGAV